MRLKSVISISVTLATANPRKSGGLDNQKLWDNKAYLSIDQVVALGNIGQATNYDLSCSSVIEGADLEEDVWMKPGAICNGTHVLGIYIPLANVTPMSGAATNYAFLPEIICQLRGLVELIIRGRGLQGQVPTCFDHFLNLRRVDFSYNHFTGAFPFSFCSAENLKHIILRSNRMSDIFPLCVTQLPKLSTLDLSSNDFFGSLPDGIGKLPAITELDLSMNRFSGTVPESLWNLTKLGSLSLRGNPIFGQIVEGIGQLQNLKHLSLTGTKFHGSIPQETSQLIRLQRFHIDDTNISGRIPNGMENLTELVDMLIEGSPLTHMPAAFDCSSSFSTGRPFCFCPTGTRQVGNSTCENCPANHFNPFLQAAVCNSCPTGTVAQATGATSILKCLCKLGFEKTDIFSAGQVPICQPCSIGQAGVELGKNCTRCLKGRYTAVEGSTECANCSLGRFADTDGSSSCSLCPAGKYSSLLGSDMCIVCPYEGQTTMRLVQAFGGAQMIPIDGAQAQDSCGCKPSMRQAGSSCVKCVEGLECAGDELIKVLPGYMAVGRDLSVFKCHGNPARCLGGSPGACCNEGRHSVACIECVPGRTSQADGTCAECTDSKVALLIGVVFTAAVCFVMFYLAVERVDLARSNQWVLLVGTCLTISVTSFQQLSIMSLFTIMWPQPLKDMFGIISLLVADVELINVGCVTNVSAITRYICKILFMACAFAFLSLIHGIVVVVMHNANFRRRMPSLVAAVGTATMIFYVTIISIVLEPFQCLQNPNGKMTVNAYQSIICWETSGHSVMLAIGLGSVTVPIALLVHSVLVVRKFPTKVAQGDVPFLRTYVFLFSRYRTEIYWYAPFSLLRSLSFSLTPLLPNTFLQIFAAHMIFIVAMVSTVFFVPWRARQANAFETGFISFLLSFIHGCSTLGSSSDSDKQSVAYVLTVLMCLPFVVAVFFVAYAGFNACLKKVHKRFHYFLCHHKAGAGCMARLLKIAIHDFKKKAFIDSDDLRDLDKLFDYVAHETQCIVLLCSTGLFLRPWCMGEVVTAKREHVNCMLLIFPEFQTPNDQFISDYGCHVQDMSELAAHGITVLMVQDAIRWAVSQQEIVLPVVLTHDGLFAVVSTLTSCAYQPAGQDGGTHDSPDKKHVKHMHSILFSDVAASARVAVLVDSSVLEAVACAMILAKLLREVFAHEHENHPHVVPEGELLPTSTKMILIICTDGAFKHRDMLTKLLNAGKLQCQHIPVLAEETFHFPTCEWLKKNRHTVIAETTTHEEALIDLIISIFRTIAVVFQPGHYGSTEQILNTKAAEIAQRLRNPKLQGSLQWQPQLMMHKGISLGESITLGEGFAQKNNHMSQEDMVTSIEGSMTLREVTSELITTASVPATLPGTVEIT